MDRETDGYSVAMEGGNILRAGDRSLVKELGRNAYEHASAEYVYPVMRQGWRKILREFAVPEYAEAI